MANIFADMIIALNDVYPKTTEAVATFREGVYDAIALDKAKQAVALYKVYASQRVSIDSGSNRNRILLDAILTDLGEASLYVERNVSILRTYICAYDPTYVEPT